MNKESKEHIVLDRQESVLVKRLKNLFLQRYLAAVMKGEISVSYRQLTIHHCNPVS